MEKIEISPIGIVHSPLKDPCGAPIQPAGGADIEGQVEVFPEFEEGLKDVDGFTYIILLFHLNRSSGYNLTVTPFMDDTPRGLFATRAPRRPGGIGLSTVRVTGVEGNKIKVCELDILDGTPLLDIKPFVPEFDNRYEAKTGWLEKRAHQSRHKKADDRFA